GGGCCRGEPRPRPRRTASTPVAPRARRSARPRRRGVPRASNVRLTISPHGEAYLLSSSPSGEAEAGRADMRVVIVGAGIAGLCTAAGLESLGADVILLERAPEVRGGGSGLSLFGNGLRALGSLGLRGVVPDPPGVSPTVSGTRRADGTWLSRF